MLMRAILMNLHLPFLATQVRCFAAVGQVDYVDNNGHADSGLHHNDPDPNLLANPNVNRQVAAALVAMGKRLRHQRRVSSVGTNLSLRRRWYRLVVQMAQPDGA